MVKFPRQLDITSPRLTWLYIVSCVIFAISFLFMVIRFDMWKHHLPIANDVWTRLYQPFDASFYPLLKAGMDKMRLEPFCTDSRDHDFWWDNSFSYRYENFTCMELCNISHSMPHCFSGYDLIRDQSDTSMTYVTSVHNDAFNGAPKSSHFVGWDPSTVKFTFYYGIDTIEQSWYGTMHTYMGESDKDMVKRHRSQKNILTIVQDFQGKERPEFPPKKPSASISFTISEILSLAGDNIALDMTHPELAPNYKHAIDGSKLSSVTPRLSGLNVKAVLACFNDPPHHSGPVWREGPVCFLKFNAIFGPWVGYHYVEPANLRQGDGLHRGREFYGLRISIAKGGEFSYPSFVYMFHALVELFVLASIPKTFVLFVATWCLRGITSKIYYQAVTQRFSIFDEAAGAASRLISYSQDFNELATTCVDDEDGEEGAFIEKETVAAHIVNCSLSGRLNQEERLGLVNFCYQAMHQVGDGKKRSDTRNLFSVDTLKNGRHRPSVSTLSGKRKGISHSNFNMCTSSDENIPFKDLVTLFSHMHEKKGILERLFSEKAPQMFTESSDIANESSAIREILEKATSFQDKTQHVSELSKDMELNRTICADVKAFNNARRLSRGNDELHCLGSNNVAPNRAHPASCRVSEDLSAARNIAVESWCLPVDPVTPIEAGPAYDQNGLLIGSAVTPPNVHIPMPPESGQPEPLEPFAVAEDEQAGPYVSLSDDAVAVQQAMYKM